jgi:hypothetical protein
VHEESLMLVELPECLCANRLPRHHGVLPYGGKLKYLIDFH